MPADIGPKPRVSTPAPYGMPTWDTPDVDTAQLDQAYQNYYGAAYAPREAGGYQPIPLINQGSKPSDGLGLHKLKEWVPLLQYDKDAKAAQQRDKTKDQLTDTYGKTLDLFKQGGKGQPYTGTYTGSGMGLGSYGVTRSGLASQRGSAPYGFQTPMWQALTGAFSAMKAAGLGTPGITDGWRSYEAQVDVKRRKGKLAATPGRSVHGIGMAADLNLNSAQQRWLEANGAKYGLYRLASEPWHWQLRPQRRG